MNRWERLSERANGFGIVSALHRTGDAVNVVGARAVADGCNEATG